MDFTFGKYNGKAIAWVLLEDPAYLKWLCESTSRDNEIEFVEYLIEQFNQRPLQTKCRIIDCNSLATHFTLYNSTYTGSYWFCSECDPYHMGALCDTLTIHSLEHLSLSFLSQFPRMIQELYYAKGGQQRKTKSSLKKFFNY